MRVHGRLHAGWAVGLVFLFAGMVGARAQSSPMKPGLWETQASSTSQMQMPPEVEAKIAAMPAAQQAQMRSMMGGMGGGGTPVSTTRQVCIAPQTTVDSMLNRAQQSAGMSCTIANKTQTATGVSFDTSCTTPQGTATGSYARSRLIDDDHVSSASHMTVTASSQGHTMNTTMDSTMSMKYLGADCGDVKPFTSAAAAK